MCLLPESTNGKIQFESDMENVSRCRVHTRKPPPAATRDKGLAAAGLGTNRSLCDKCWTHLDYESANKVVRFVEKKARNRPEVIKEPAQPCHSHSQATAATATAATAATAVLLQNCWDAVNSGVAPDCFAKSIEAPALQSKHTISKCPISDANCRPVHPSCTTRSFAAAAWL